MKRLFALLALALSFSALAAYEGTVVRLSEGPRAVEEAFTAGRYLYQDSTFIFTSSEKSAQYPAGDFAIMWGLGASDSNQQMTRDEYNRMWKIMNYLSSKGFRVIMNVRAEGSDIKDAVETEGTSVVLFSGHGNTSGFYDFSGSRVSYDLFTNKAKSMYQFIVSACYGTQSRGNYNPPADMIMYTWSGLTNTNDLETFLMGSWSGLEGKDLAVRE